jgi:quercetin dioxygenase-like cupin family protein
MTEHERSLPLIVDAPAVPWKDHPRFPGIRMQQLLTPQDNRGASVSRVRVPPGGVVGWHSHPEQVETVYVLAGRSTLTLGEQANPFAAGQIVAIPPALVHTLRNEGAETVELLCFFTPPAGEGG